MIAHSTLEDLVDPFDAFLIDQFGVLLSGDGAYPFAPDALDRLCRAGKKLVLLSNSGKRSKPNEDRLTRLGFSRESYMGVLSSGEAAYHHLESRIGKDIPPGAAVLVLSRDNDVSAIAGLDLAPTDAAGQAGLVLLAGSRGDVFDLAHYQKILAPAAERGIPCLCTNPDTTMLTKDGLCFGAGRIAQLYEELGGAVEWIGKPHPLIYGTAKSWLSGIDPTRVLCVGDSPAHDILGGQRAGFKTALVRTGIHANDPQDAVLELCQGHQALPDFLIPRFGF